MTRFIGMSFSRSSSWKINWLLLWINLRLCLYSLFILLFNVRLWHIYIRGQWLNWEFKRAFFRNVVLDKSMFLASLYTCIWMRYSKLAFSSKSTLSNLSLREFLMTRFLTFVALSFLPLNNKWHLLGFKGGLSARMT